MGMPMRAAMTQLLRRARPQRVLIEPTGLGHLGTLLDLLRTPPLAAALDVRVSIALVAPARHAALWASSEIYRGQLECADVVVINQADAASPQAVSEVCAL